MLLHALYTMNPGISQPQGKLEFQQDLVYIEKELNTDRQGCSQAENPN